MLHSPICGPDGRPPTWRSSLAIYRYDVVLQAGDTPPLPGFDLTYLKVDVTLSPEIVGAPPVSFLEGFIPMSQVPNYGKAYPCYGALLQVSIGKKTSGNDSDFYFADFEPKKRELYETVTDTGQVLSGSQSGLVVGKSTTNSQTTENFSKFGAALSVGSGGGGEGGAGGASGSASANYETGSRESSGVTVQDIKQFDASTERREVQSHTTQLSQLYSLFQSYHVGTNRAMFFIEPRPHQLQGHPTFINGPRALEGIQSVFLVVVRPAGVDFCVSTHLDCAHLDVAKVSKDAVKTTEFRGSLDASGPLGEKGKDDWIAVTQEFTWKVADHSELDGWQIDVESTKAKPISQNSSHPEANSRDKVEIISITETEVKLRAKAHYHIYTDGPPWDRIRHSDPNTLDFGLNVTLIPTADLVRDGAIESMWLSSRNLCCCDSVDKTDQYTRVGYEKPVPPIFTPIQPGPATPPRVNESSQVALMLREEMMKSIGSTQRYSGAGLPFTESNVFLNEIARMLAASTANKELTKSLSLSTAIAAQDRDQVVRVAGDLSIMSFIKTNPHSIAYSMGRSVTEVLEIKANLLRSINPLPPPPVTASPLRQVIGVRFGSTYPSPDAPTILRQVSDLRTLYGIPLTSQPNVIEIDFNDRPDAGTLNPSTLFVTKNGAPVSSQLIQLTPSSARIIIQDALQANAIYTLTAVGTGATPIKFGGKALDGDPINIPSGDGVEGGDFVVAMKVLAPAAPPSIPPLPLTLIRIIGARIQSNVPDPVNPKTLVTLMDIADVVQTRISDQPNVIQVDFNVAPDPGTLTTSTFTVSTDAGSVATTLALVSPTTARLTITDPLIAGGVYTVTLRGNTEPTVKYQGRKLDGEGTRIPSGNNVGGGDFTFKFKATPSEPTPPPPTILAKVIALRIRTSVPDPVNPRTLHEVINLNDPHVVQIQDSPDIIDVDFNVAPDPGTVAMTTFTLSNATGPIAGVVSQLSSTRYRFKANSVLTAIGNYTMKLSGATPPVIMYQGRALDGDPIGLPSGNGEAGGDFYLQFWVENNA